MLNLKFAFVAASTLALTACIVQPLPSQYNAYDEGYGNDAVVEVAPPAPYPEVVPIAPYLGAVWVGGYWGWSGGRHVWTRGHYVHGREGYIYRQPAWNRDGRGRYHFHRGGWGRH